MFTDLWGCPTRKSSVSHFIWVVLLAIWHWQRQADEWFKRVQHAALHPELSSLRHETSSNIVVIRHKKSCICEKKGASFIPYFLGDAIAEFWVGKLIKLIGLMSHLLHPVFMIWKGCFSCYKAPPKHLSFFCVSWCQMNVNKVQLPCILGIFPLANPVTTQIVLIDIFLSESEAELNPWFGPFLSNLLVYFVYRLNEHFVNAFI